jgi:hypothetical protein
MAYLPLVSRVRKDLEFQALTGAAASLSVASYLLSPLGHSQMERDKGVFIGRTLNPSPPTHRRK